MNPCLICLTRFLFNPDETDALCVAFVQTPEPEAVARVAGAPARPAGEPQADLIHGLVLVDPGLPRQDTGTV
jgi:hypothetical protein